MFIPYPGIPNQSTGNRMVGEFFAGEQLANKIIAPIKKSFIFIPYSLFIS
jgi:hypothetical protein